MKESDYIIAGEQKNVRLAKDLLLDLAGTSADPHLLRSALDAVDRLASYYEEKINIETE